jgi:hypothetical protein
MSHQFQFILVEGGVKFMKNVKEAQAIKVWEPYIYRLSYLIQPAAEIFPTGVSCIGRLSNHCKLKEN